MKVSLTPRSLLPNQNNEISALCVRVPGEDLKPCPSALIHPFASEIKHVLTLACKQSYNYNVHTCTSSGHIPLLIIPLSSTCPILSKYAFDYIKQCRLLCCFFCYSFVFACVWVCVYYILRTQKLRHNYTCGFRQICWSQIAGLCKFERLFHR